MDLNKAALFVKGICRKAEDGQLTWEETGLTTAFQTTIGKFVVRIEVLTNDDGVETYVISLFGSNGQRLDRYTDDDFDVDEGRRIGDEYFTMMREAYDNARRQALGVEQALDDVLGALESVTIPKVARLMLQAFKDREVGDCLSPAALFATRK